MRQSNVFHFEDRLPVKKHMFLLHILPKKNGRIQLTDPDTDVPPPNGMIVTLCEFALFTINITSS